MSFKGWIVNACRSHRGKRIYWMKTGKSISVCASIEGTGELISGEQGIQLAQEVESEVRGCVGRIGGSSVTLGGVFMKSLGGGRMEMMAMADMPWSEDKEAALRAQDLVEVR